MSDTLPAPDAHLRVGDAERRAVDERLHRAVGAGLLTLGEYDERARAVWAARTRGELAAVVRDLPVPAATPPALVRPRRRHRVGWCVALVAGTVLLGAAVLPGQTEVVSVALPPVALDVPPPPLGGPLDVPAPPPPGLSAGVGDRTLFVQPGQRELTVEGGVGDVTVVVPDGVRAVLTRTGGVGDLECDDACETSSTQVVTITVTSGVGDVEVLTRSEHDD